MNHTNIKRVLQIELSNELKRMLNFCIEYCSVDCCGSRAFSIEKRTFRNWILGEKYDHTEKMNIELQDHLKTVAESDENFVEFVGLGASWPNLEAKSFLARASEVFQDVLADLEK